MAQAAQELQAGETVSAWLPSSEASKLRARAQAGDRSISWEIRRAIDRYLNDERRRVTTHPTPNRRAIPPPMGQRSDRPTQKPGPPVVRSLAAPYWSQRIGSANGALRRLLVELVEWR